jgi:hypothetical protein
MHTLFHTSKANLSAFFNSLSDDDIRDCCSLSVFRRGEDYFDSDCVDQAAYNKDKTSLKAIVNGSMDYTVRIALDGGRVSGSCTCPCDDVCKHLVATLLFAADVLEIETESDDAEDTENLFHQYLQSLSKDELAALVEKFAPDRFRAEVKNKYAKAGSALTAFRNVEQKIRKILGNDYLMHNFHDFNQAIDAELAKLSGFEKPLQKELEKFLFEIMEKIDNAVESGDLYEYDDDYGYEPSSFFIDFFAGYVASLDTVQKTAFLSKLDAALNKQSYNTFEQLRDVVNSIFTDDDLPHLKNELIAEYKNLSRERTGRYYNRVHHLLSYDEKTAILKALSERDDKRIVELATLHDANGELSKAIDTLKNWLPANRGAYSCHENVHTLYLDLLKKGNRELSDAAADVIVHCPTCTMLSNIVSLNCGDSARYELLLEQKSAGELLRYMQKNERLPEALALIQRNPDIYDNLVNEFFRAHKTLFPDEATAYFSKIIDKNLENTGDRYYEAIAEAIRQMMTSDLTRANEYLDHIRTNYKRRSNLMKMLNRL